MKLQNIYVFTDENNYIKGFILSKNKANTSENGKIIFTNAKVLFGVDIKKAKERRVELEIKPI